MNALIVTNKKMYIQMLGSQNEDTTSHEWQSLYITQTLMYHFDKWLYDRWTGH